MPELVLVEGRRVDKGRVEVDWVGIKALIQVDGLHGAAAELAGLESYLFLAAEQHRAAHIGKSNQADVILDLPLKAEGHGRANPREAFRRGEDGVVFV